MTPPKKRYVEWSVHFDSANEKEAWEHFNRFKSETGLTPEEEWVDTYEKFPNRYQCVFRALMGNMGDADVEKQIDAIKKTCAQIGEPWIETGPDYYNNGAVTYDALIDHRKHDIHFEKLTWAHCAIYS